MLKMRLLLLFITIFNLARSQSPTTENGGDTTVITEGITTLNSTTVNIGTPETNTPPEISTTISTTTATAVITTTEATTTDITTTTIETTTTIPVLFFSDGQDEVIWSPKSTQSVIIQAEEGYKISVNVTDCNIDGSNGEYATISTDEDSADVFFTYGVKIRPAYLFNNNVLYATFVGSANSNFTVSFTRVGEALTTVTTEVPTTAIILPTPAYNDSSTLLVYLDGKTINDYLDLNTEILNDLRDCIGAMAAEYCVNENFPLNGSVTEDNVVVNSIIPCPITWHDSETCIQLNFSVPVNLLEDSNSQWSGYQMDSRHLKIMWDRYAVAYLPPGITIYVLGNDNFKWGIAILVVGTLLFALVLLAIRHYGMKFSKMVRRRKLSDTTSIISASDRNSQISLPPHYLQETPALFENAYPMYNPSDKNPEYSDPSFQYPDYQDLTMELEPEDNEENEKEESGA